MKNFFWLFYLLRLRLNAKALKEIFCLDKIIHNRRRVQTVKSRQIN